MGSWIKALKEDKNEIFRAAHDASAATDFVLSLEREVSKAEALEIGNSAITDTEKVQVIRDETETLEYDRDVAGSIDRDNSAPSDSTPAGNGERENTRFVARMDRESVTVAVHDKSLGNDQHTPVDTLAISKGGGPTEEHSPGQPSRDGLSASFAAAKAMTGREARRYRPNLPGTDSKRQLSRRDHRRDRVARGPTSVITVCDRAHEALVRANAENGRQRRHRLCERSRLRERTPRAFQGEGTGPMTTQSGMYRTPRDPGGFPFGYNWRATGTGLVLLVGFNFLAISPRSEHRSCD